MQTSKQDHLNSARQNWGAKTDLLEIKRDFTSSVDKLFAAFKTPEALKAWWWPKGLYADRVEIDFREGGRYFFNMKGFDRGGGGMTGEFKEIVDNTRIVMTDHFADKEGKAITAAEANMPGEWPEEILITLEFTTLDKYKSRLYLAQTGIPSELRADCIQGWSQSFDKLEQYLAKSKH